ncbi:hypothetical protein [Streptomyces mutomycini]|uniref:hypothetical protein n=1 Tax=Streptomyces mutomycini TaxID=284036 RepID=UPI0033F9ABDB
MTTDSYLGYSDRLHRLASDLSAKPWPVSRGEVQSALNGQAAEQLRVLVPRTVRRAEGAFFTGSHVRARFEELLEDATAFWDPACGAGDLLLAAAGKQDLGASMRDTLDLWGKTLRGGDLQPSFVRTARLRLFLLAAARHKERGDPIDVDVASGLELLKGIRVADAYSDLEKTRSYSGTLLLNPPFGSVQAPADCSWAGGSVSQAAVISLMSASKIGLGQQFVAILPDVLRSGSRYARWRSSIESIIDLRSVNLYGQFDDHTDVDVFLLAGRRRRQRHVREPSALWWPQRTSASTIEDIFKVSVGTVVDNRDPHAGPKLPFLIARDLGDLKEIQAPDRTRQFAGRTFKPPFVAIRRTSRPGLRSGGNARAAGTLVTGTQDIAVDNHIIVMKSQSGSVDECNQLIDVLSSPKTSAWLDNRIRCRHLTVGVVRSIPWSPKAARDEDSVAQELSVDY